MFSHKKLHDLFKCLNNNNNVVLVLSFYAGILVTATMSELYSSPSLDYVDNERDSSNEFFIHGRNLIEIGDNNNMFNLTILDNVKEVAKNSNDESLPSLFPLKESDYYGFFFAILGLLLAAGGGIGGGGILVPIYIIVMGLSTKHAIPLSNVTVVGGAIANNWLNRNARHPFADRPIVDWDLILVMVPLTVLGALIGAFINKVLPEFILTLLLVVLLTVTAYTSLKKAVKMYQKESLQMTATKSELTLFKPESITEPNGSNSIVNNASIETADINKQNDLETILQEERHTPYRNVFILCSTFMVVLIVNLAKGGGAFPSPFGITCGSVSFWLSNLFLVVWIVSVQIYLWHYFVNRHKLKVACGYKYLKGDIHWDETNSIVYPLICCMAGFFAGMFGIGGGIVTAPLMLAMGVDPKVNSASTAAMILFTALTATTSYIVFGLLLPDYGIICFVIGFAATYVGHEGAHYYMKRFKRNSLIAFSIGSVVLISAIMMTLESVLKILSGEADPPRGICHFHNP